MFASRIIVVSAANTAPGTPPQPQVFYTATTSAALLLLIAAALHVTYALCLSPYRHIPGPWLCKLTSLVAVYHDVRLQRTRKIHEWHARYGPVVLVAPREVSFAGVAATREIYGAAGRHPKSRYFDNFVVASAGAEHRATFNTLGYDEHRERRKLSFAFFQATTMYTPAFVDHVRARARAFVGTVERDLAREAGTSSSTTIDMLHRINLYAFDNVTRLLFGAKHSTAIVDAPTGPSCDDALPERSMLEGLKDCETWNTLLFNAPWAHRVARAVLARLRRDSRFLSAEDELAAWCTARIGAATRDPDFLLHQGAAGGDDDDCLLRRLARHRTKTGEPLATPWVYAEVLDNVSAAQATVTVALTYVLWNIAHSAGGWQDRIREELAALPCTADGFPSFADINDAPILEAAIKESYRLNPLSSGRAERVVPIGKEYDAVFVPKGTIVSTSTVAIHHTPAVFTSPHEYNPGRWLQASAEHLRAMHAHYIPFGYGARLCLGKSFATLEVKLLVAFLLLRYAISEEPRGRTNVETMKQLGTQDALPQGLCCDLSVRPLHRTPL